jgi:alpha-L-fucosidase
MLGGCIHDVSSDPTDDRRALPRDHVRRVAEFGEWRRALFARDLAARARVRARGSDAPASRAERVVDGDPDTYWSAPAGTRTGWIELELEWPTTFDVASLQEAIAHGQSVERYRLEAWTGSAWSTLSRGTTIGHRKLDRFPAVTADRVRLTIDSALDTPRIASWALYRSAGW